MSISSLTFILFLLCSVVLYYLIPRRARWIVLLIASIVFYLSYATAAVYLVATVLVTYLCGIWLERFVRYKPDAETKEEKQNLKKQNDRKKRAVLTFALLLDFSSLIFLKYSGFLVQLTNNLFSFEFPIPDFLIPLGISFYVFQTVGYLIDIYRGKYGAQRNLAKYALFVCYFPQMLQGPINRYDALGCQLFGGNDFKTENIQYGILRIMYGILKKALIADTLAPVVEIIYGNYGAYPGVVSFIGAGIYCLQLYCDFSAGIDIVNGASALFGVRMQENFCQPYFATSLADFWRRWHISLGEWMKDYLFYPIALSKHMNKLSKFARKYCSREIGKRLIPCVATFVVFLAVGAWQGPGMANIAYGLWNGFWMSLGVISAPVGNKLNERFSFRSHKKTMVVAGCLFTNFLVIIGRYFSNAKSLSAAIGMLKHTFSAPGITQLSTQIFSELGFSLDMSISLIGALAVVLVISIAKERGTDVPGWICRQRWYVQFPILFVGFLLLLFCVYGNSDYVPIAYVYENV